MRIFKAKKLTSIFLIVIILNMSIINSFAVVNFDVIEDEDTVRVYDEEKIICNATLDDDFADDRVLVMMKNSASLELKNYSKEDFSEIDVKEVFDYTEEKVVSIKNELAEYEELFAAGETNKVHVSSSKPYSEEKSVIGNIAEDTQAIEMAEQFIKKEYNDFHQLLEIRLNNSGKQEVLNAVKELEKQDDILVVEPDYIAEICFVPNDTYYSKQWSVDNLSLTSAWNITTGSSNVKVGIIDSGIHASHSDLYNNIDRTLSKSFISDDPLEDKHGHGTWIAGVIGAIGNNKNGVAGICWSPSLVSLQVFNDSMNPKSSSIIKAIKYANDNSINIINLSIHMDYSYILDDTVKNYNGLVICGSANDGKNIDIDGSSYPSNLPYNNIISVAAIDVNNNLASYSNYGNISVDLAAPGVDVYTTYIGNTSDKYYSYGQGTSIATPHVVGVAALIKSKYPTISSSGIKSAILDGTDKVDSLKRKVKTGGKLNAYKALKAVENHTYNIKYNSNGGSGTAMADTVVTYGINTMLRKNTYLPPKGKKFDGWNAYRASDKKWYYTNGTNSGWYLEGSQPSGYKKHLYSDEVNVAHTTSVSNDTVTMYAQWSYINYTVTFNSNGGTGQTMPSQQITYGTYQKLRKNTYTKQGYVFYGWYGYRKSDNKWLYDNGTSDCWCLEGSEPSGYQKHIYKDEITVGKSTTVHNDTVIMYANWLRIGDVDLDGILDINDVTLLQKYVANIVMFTDTQRLVADVNGDGKISIEDATALQYLI